MATNEVSWRILDHGVDGSQYFPGHVAFTSYTHCVTGCGDSPGEAFEDALDQLAAVLADAAPEAARAISAEIEGSEEGQALLNSTDDAHADCAPEEGEDPNGDWHDACELYWYVSIDVRIPEVG